MTLLAMAQNFAMVCFAVAIIFAIHRLYTTVADPLSKIPGPIVARVTRLWLFYEVYRGSLPQSLIDLHRRHGPVVRIAPGQYSIDDPAAVAILYGAGKNFIKAPWYEASGNPNSILPSLFVERDPHRHSAFRRKVASVYSMTNLVSLETFVDSCTELLLEKLHTFARNDVVIDVSHWTQCYAFDVIGKLTLGDRFGFLDQGSDIQGIMASLRQYLFYVARVGVYSEWHKWLFWVFQKLSTKASGIAHVGLFSRERVDARFRDHTAPKTQDKTVPADFLTKLLAIYDQETKKMNKDDIFAVCVANVGAGSDTTSISLNAVLYYLYRDPRVLSKLREEIAMYKARGDVANPIAFRQGQDMPYLQVVIKEALRMHPAAAYPLVRIVPSGGTTIGGHDFPPGTILGISAWVAHANCAVFGSDAAKFRPERWLEDPETTKRREAYFMSFGSGSRTCIGKNISLMELTKVTVEIVQYFDFEFPHADSGWKTENVWFVKQTDFRSRIRARSTTMIGPQV